MTTDAPIAQRWERPEIYTVPPGFWKRQLPTDLLEIAAKGVVPALKQLLQEQPGTLNQRGSHGRTLLWEAVRAGRLEAVKFLLAQGADVALTGCYNSESLVQISPLCVARFYTRAAIVELLLARGARDDVFRLAYLGEAEGVMEALAAQPELLNAEDPHDEIYFTPLIAFAIAGDQPDLAQDLVARGATLAPYSAQLLHLAARTGRIGLLDLLLTRGADIRAIDSGLFVPAPIAAIAYLLAHGAPVNNPGKNGFPPLVLLARADKGRRLNVMELLLANGADVNATGPRGRTALHLAAAGGHADVLNLMLAHGARPELEDDSGKTALQLARAAGKTQIVGILKRG